MPLNENHGIVCKFGNRRQTVQIFNLYHHTLLEMRVNCDKALEIGSFIEIKGDKQDLITDSFNKMNIEADDLKVDEREKNELHLIVRVLCAKTSVLGKEHKEMYGEKARSDLLGQIGDTRKQLDRFFKMGRMVKVLVKFDPKDDHIFDVVEEIIKYEKDYVPLEEVAKKTGKGKNNKTESVDKVDVEANVPELNENMPVGSHAPEPIEKKKRGPGRPKSKAQPVTTQSVVKTELGAKEQSSEAEVPASIASRISTKVLEEPEKYQIQPTRSEVKKELKPFKSLKTEAPALRASRLSTEVPEQEAKSSQQFEAKEPSRVTTRAQKKAAEKQNA